jgi:hypothetical protein
VPIYAFVLNVLVQIAAIALVEAIFYSLKTKNTLPYLLIRRCDMKKVNIVHSVAIVFLSALLLTDIIPNALITQSIAGEARNVSYEQLQQQRQAQFNLIKAVQRKLKENGYDPGPVDGLMGPRTSKAVERYQRDNGLVVDGIPGEKTLISLGLRSE